MDEHVIGTYARQAPVFVSGRGSQLYDREGKAYLDLLSGLGVSALGHSHPDWVAAVQEQAAKLVHVSNLYHHELTQDVAQRLCRLSGLAQVFFSNSGTESVECALKIARKAQASRGREDRTSFVALQDGFHGRTLGSLAVTSSAAYREPFAPLSEVGFVPREDVPALEQALQTHRPAALILEPLQGEGGVQELSVDYLRYARELCDRHATLLVSDEVQCGMYRTGTFLAIEESGVQPDIVTLAKPLAGGLPIGATLIAESLQGVLVPGDHGSTFGGGPLALRGAQVVLAQLEQPTFLGSMQQRGAQLSAGLQDLAARHGAVTGHRGRGLMQGLVLPGLASTIQGQLLEAGFLVGTAAGDVLRLLPPFVITETELEEALAQLDQALHHHQPTPLSCNP